MASSADLYDENEYSDPIFGIFLLKVAANPVWSRLPVADEAGEELHIGRAA